MDRLSADEDPDEVIDEALRARQEGRRVQSVMCGRCGWPSACVAQEGLRLLTFLCDWCGKTTVGVVDPSIKRNVIF